MKIDISITPDVASQEQAVETLRRASNSSARTLSETKRKEISKVAKDFEALFLNMMLKSMRQTIAEDKITGGGKAEETYRFLLDQEYANLAANKGGVGIASMVEKDLLKRYGDGGVSLQKSKNRKSEE